MSGSAVDEDEDEEDDDEDDDDDDEDDEDEDDDKADELPPAFEMLVTVVRFALGTVLLLILERK